jgi:hypothetical protein
MKRNLYSLAALLTFVFLFWASSTPEKLSKTFNTYEEVNKKESVQVPVSFELPIITPSSETKQTQTKGGVTITCEVIPYELQINDIVTKNVFYADPTKPGYDIFEISHTPKPVAVPDDFELNIKIKNNQERILKVRETALLLQIDGITVHIPEASLTDWYAGMIIKNGEFNYKIKVPEFNSLLNAKLVYLFINDVPTIMDEGGNIKKRENFEWFFECKKQYVEKKAPKTYTYETKLIESKRCDKCSGTGTDPQAYQCSTCKGKGTTVNIFDGKTYKCSTCSGTGIVHQSCPDCSGRGTLYFPKSHLPAITKSVDWNGYYIKIKTLPANAIIKLIVPETGQYKVNTGYNGSYPWYCSYGKSCPIIVEYDGKEVKVMPYTPQGKESKSIVVDFTKGTPVVTGGTKVN